MNRESLSRRFLMRWGTAALICGALAPHGAHAQDPLPSVSIERLIQQMQQQDQRIADLEDELAQSHRPLQSARFRMLQDDESHSNNDDDRASSGGDLTELEERLEQLESDLGDLSDESESFDDRFIADGTDRTTMKLTGRIHIDGWGFAENDPTVTSPAFEGQDPQNQLSFRRLRLGIAGDIQQNMLYKIEFDFAEGNDVAIKDAYLGWEELPYLQTVLIGNQKRPYGLDALNSSRFNVFLERPYINDLYTPDARRLGLLSYGVSDDLAYNWSYGVMNPIDVQDSGIYRGDHLQLELAGRLANTIWYDEISGGRGYAHWAVSGSLANPKDDPLFPNAADFSTRPEARSEGRWIDTGAIAGADHYQLLGLEGVVNVGALQIVGEYMSSRVDRDRGFADTHFDGSYIYAAYFLTGEHVPWDRESGTIDRTEPFQNFWLVNRCDGGTEAGWGAWQAAARYSQADFTDADIFGGAGESFTFAVNWYWNANARLQFNYIDGRIDQRTAALLANDYTIYGARFSVDF